MSLPGVHSRLTVALVQAGSALMHQQACLDKVAAFTARAASQGAQLVVFPEAFIPGYPRGLTFGTVVGSRSDAGREDWLRYWSSSVEVPGAAVDYLSGIARKSRVYLSMGVIERDCESSRGTLYCTILYFGPDGSYLGKHRKLKPTGSERLIWGEGDGSTLTVLDTPFGKIGGLICWENYMPLARAAMYYKGVGIYLAPTADSRDGWQATLRHIALEGRCFVLGCNQFVTKDMYPHDLACYHELAAAPDVMCRGGSAIVDPLGNYIAEPVYGREELVVATLDLDLVAKSRYDFDVVGHYARNDVFRLEVNEKKQQGFRPAN